jgi:hypothetical protein
MSRLFEHLAAPKLPARQDRHPLAWLLSPSRTGVLARIQSASLLAYVAAVTKNAHTSRDGGPSGRR